MVLVAEHHTFHFYSDVDLFRAENNLVVKVNGLEIPITNLPYQHPTGTPCKQILI